MYATIRLLLVIIVAVTARTTQADPPPLVLESGNINVLMADRARLTGLLQVTVWGKPEGRAWVKNWRQPEDSCVWSIDAPEAGRYEVSVLVQGKAGSEAEIIGQAGRLSFRLPKGWDKLTLSEPLPLPKGPSTITLRLRQPDDACIKSLELVNVSAHADIQRRIQQLRASTRWLRDAKYGLMFQWGGWGYPQHGPKKPWPRMIDDFDVEAFARMVEETGAGYVIWSATWCTYHFPAPIKAIDRIAPGHTSQRDLIGDLADALARRNIRLMLYYHEGHPDKDWWPKNWDPSDPDRKEKFVNNLCGVLTEVSQRYGKKLSGWFLDDGMLYYPAPFERITKALKAGNPDCLVSYNSWILPRLTEFQEVYMGEGFCGSAATPLGSDGIFPSGPQKGLFAQGMFVLDGPDWGINHPDTKINRPGFSAEKATGLVRRASERGQTLSFNLLMYEDGSVSPESLEVMQAVRKAIRENSTAGADASRRWSAEKAWQWYNRQPWICGFNYIPATSINYTEMWQRESFDPKTIDGELALAQQVGFNSLRCVLQYLVWEHDPEGFKQRLEECLAICQKRGIRVVFCLFDDCVFGPKHDPYLGKQADVVSGWYAHDWSPSPGWSRVKDSNTWPKLQQYVRDVLTRFKDDPRVLVWDLYNEPTNGIGDVTLPLVTEVFATARMVNPSQPLTVGVWNENKALNELAIGQSDIITFHRYSDPKQLEEIICSLERHGRPLICTEWLKRDWGTVTDQLPVFVRHRVGCLHWGLVNGKTQTQYPWGSKAGALEPKVWQHDIFRRDCTPYDPREIEAFKQAIAENEGKIPHATRGKQP